MKRRADNREIQRLTVKVAKQQQTIAHLLTKLAALQRELSRRG